MTPPVALTVAGVDSAGGAGIHADLRAMAAHRVHGAAVVAAVTAQSTAAVLGVHRVPADFVALQIRAVTEDLAVRATKTGFLGSAEVVAVVADAAAHGRLGDLVVDPVLVSSAGASLFGADVTSAYLGLIPRARVVTPNRLEAGLLTGATVRTVADMEAAAATLCDLGAEVVVVKGGDAEDEGDRSVDVVATRSAVVRLELPAVETPNDHGSGCTLSAAIAAGLARGDPPVDAVRAAKSFVHRALVGARAWRLGAGHGPVDALGWDAG